MRRTLVVDLHLSLAENLLEQSFAGLLLGLPLIQALLVLLLDIFVYDSIQLLLASLFLFILASQVLLVLFLLFKELVLELKSII